MPELPTGTVTFLFTDIEGSTRLLKQLRDRYGELVAEHRRVLRGVFAEHSGVEVDSQGDECFAAFRRAEDAVSSAVSLQRAFAAHPWPGGVSVRVRVGIHTGHGAVSDGRYHGVAVHRAARIMAAAHGGQALLSQTTHDLLTDEEAELDGVGLLDLGEQRLKDLDRPVRLYQLTVSGVPNAFPPLRGVEAAPPTAAGWRRWKLLAPVLTALLAAAVAIPILAFGERGAGRGALSQVSANAVGLIDARNNELTAEVPVGTNPNGIAAGNGAVWVSNADSHTVSRIDPATNTQRQTIDVGSEPEGVAFGAGAVWVANGLDGTVSRIDPGTNRVVETVPVGNGPTGVTVGFGSVWVTNANDGTVSRIDPESGHTKTLAAGAGASGIAIGAGSVWVANEQAGTVSRIDPSSNDLVTAISVGNGPNAIAFAANGIWVANGTDGTVSRISSDTNRQTLVKEVGAGPSGLAVGEDAVWVANEFAGSVSRIDLTSLSIRTIVVGNRPTGIAVLGGSVYVAVRPATAAHRGGTLVALFSADAFNERGPAYLDPGVGYSYPPLGSIVYDTLVAYEKVGGRRGFHLVADLAQTIPVPSEGGMTYTVQLRPDLHYSDGRPVAPSDFLYALERMYELESWIAQDIFAGSPVGGAACLERPRRCDLSRGVVVDAAINTLTFHLVAPDPEFVYKLTLLTPVPRGTPIRALDGRPPPGTGPYLVASNTAKALTLVRNPRFRVWSQAARPDGYPDKIIARPETSPVAALKAAEHGVVDFAEAKELWNLPRAVLREIETKYSGQAFFNPFNWTNFFVLNTNLPPFDDLRVRKAVNYAFDRSEAIRLQGGPKSGQPTCQLLPLNFPGYRRYCPYTLNPSPSGAWTAPDLAKAKRLIAASRTKGMAITVWACDAGCYGRTVADSRYFAALLRRLGYRARLKVVPVSVLRDAVQEGTRVQTAMRFQLATLGVASEFLSDFRCSGGGISLNWGFCDRRIDAQIERALALRTTDGAAAIALWARIDQEIVDQAVILPVLNPNAFDFVSKRVGNYQYTQGTGGLRDQLWVR